MQGKEVWTGKGWVLKKRQETVQDLKTRQQQSDHRTHARVLMINRREELAHSCESILLFPSSSLSKAISHTVSQPSLPTVALYISWHFFFSPILACLIYSNFQNDVLSNSDVCLWLILGCQISLSKVCLSLFAKEKVATNSKGKNPHVRKNLELHL